MRSISLALTAIEDALEMETTPLIDPSLFKTTSRISLPVQVYPFTEDNLKNAILYTLIESNIKAYPEVELSDIGGRIDILTESFGFSIGIECKEKLSKLGKKDYKYSNSGVLNALYFASFAIGDYELDLNIFESTLKGEESKMQLLSRYEFAKKAIQMRGKSLEEVIEAMRSRETSYEDRTKILRSLREKYEFGLEERVPYGIGIILYNPLGEAWVVERAEPLPKTYVHKEHYPIKEAFIKFSVWKYFKEQGYIVASESRLPNAIRVETKYLQPKLYQRSNGDIRIRYGHRRVVYSGHNIIDITAMPKSDVNSTKPQIIGVECKPSASKTQLSKLKEQLLNYRNSGDVSYLYIAIPERYHKPLLEFLCKSDFEDVGILGVDNNGNVEEIREAELLKSIEHIRFINIEKRCVRSGKFKERLYVH